MIIKNPFQAYFRDRWSTFDGTMAFFILISVLLQTFELCGASCGLSNGTALSMLRAPRPLIMIRFIRGLINVSKSEIFGPFPF